MDWIQVASQADADRLMTDFWGFHDSCIREGHLLTDYYVGDDLRMRGSLENNHHMKLHVQSQSRPLSSIELRFEGIVRINYVPPPKNYDNIIFSATLLVEEEAIYWAPTGGWKPDKIGDNDCTWISARKLFWRARNHLGRDRIYDKDEPDAYPPNKGLDGTGFVRSGGRPA